MDEDEDGAQVLHTRRTDLKARTPNQSVYLDNIAHHDITFGIGPAGTGKTYLAVACAVDALERSAVQRIVLTRPAVEAGEKLGFLPGDLTQKVDPYLRPLYDALYDLMGFDRVAKAFERNALEIAPLAFMRGRTLNNAFVILDEAQNTTPEQMKMFLTRIGFGAKAVVTGDISQIDLPKGQLSRAGRGRAHPQARQGHRPHPLHQRRRGAASAGGAHRRCLRRRAQERCASRRDRRRWTCSLQFGRISEAAAAHRARAQARRACARWIGHALARPGEIAVRIVGEEEGAALNRQYRGKDYATNVLTFDYAREPVVMADLVLCGPVVEREAREQRKTLQAHYAHLLVHGTLHAQGYDHETGERDALEMEALEILLLGVAGRSPTRTERARLRQATCTAQRNRHRPVVDQVHLHVGGELAGLHDRDARRAPAPRGSRRAAGLPPARAALVKLGRLPPRGVGGQRELAHQQQAAARRPARCGSSCRPRRRRCAA